MKVYLCILLGILVPYAIGMDQNEPAKDEGLPSSPDDELCDSADQSPDTPGPSPPPSRGPSRSRSVGQLGRIPYTIVSPRKLNPRLRGAGGGVNGSSMASVPESVQALAGLGSVAGGNVAGAAPSSSAAFSEAGSLLHTVGSYGFPSHCSQLDLGPQRRRRHSAIDRPCGSGLYTSQSGAYGTSKTNQMFEQFENLNLSTKIVPKIGTRAPAPGHPHQYGAPVENLGTVTRTLLAVLRGIHADYISPMGLSNPSVRDHRTLMRLLERVSASLQTIREHPEAALGLQRIDSDLFALTSARIPEVIADIRRAVEQYDAPDIDHGRSLRIILDKVMPDLFTIVEQIRVAI